MNIIKLAVATAVIGVSVAPAAADAALLNFELSGGRNLSFQLDSNPTPDSSQTFLGEQAVFRMVPGMLNGSATTFGVISFGTGVFADLSITAPGLDFTQFSGGGPLFSGPGSAPVFAAGTFQLTNAFFPEQNSTLVISELAAAVPEPATWAMLILGFGLLGAGLRRGHNAARQRYATAA